MYAADGIDLTRTEHDELMRVMRLGDGAAGLVESRTELDPALAPAYRKLFEYGLIRCKIAPDGVVLGAEATRKAGDWVASYEKSVRDARKATLRDVLLMVLNVLLGAASGGVVAYLLFAWYGIA